MDIRGKITIFPKMRGKIKFFEGSISKKDESGNYINCSVEIKFGKDKFPNKKLDTLEVGKCYGLDITNGFISIDSWEDKQTHDERRKLVFIVLDGYLTDGKELKASKNK